MTSTSIQSNKKAQNAENGKVSTESIVKPKDYQAIAQEMRELMIDCASQMPCYLGSSLGLVETTIAITEVFDCLHDKVFYEGGHHGMPYQILTDRKDKIYRQGYKDGISHTQNPAESPYDNYLMGHLGTSVSVALGFSYHHPEYKSIAIVGDASFTNGEIYEALNHAGALQTNLLVIYNQNGYSVDTNTGFLDRGTTLKEFSESLGFEYVGVVDGHNTEELIDALTPIKEKKYPVFLQIKTVKGKGYKLAEKYPVIFHNTFTNFDKKTGRLHSRKSAPDTVVSGQIINAMQEKGSEYLKKYPNMYFVYPSLPILANLKQEDPERVIDTGITEEHCMMFASALAAAGNKVLMSIYGYFLLRAYDQLTEACEQQGQLIINVFSSSMSEHGPNHQTVYLRGVMKQIPRLTIMEPATLLEYEQMLDFCLSYDKPVAIMVPYTLFNDRSVEFPYPSEGIDIQPGKGVVFKQGDRLTVASLGSFFPEALKLSQELEGVELIHPRFLKPFDWELLQKSVAKTGSLLLLEENAKRSSSAADIALYLLEKGVQCNIKTVTVPDIFIPYGSDGNVKSLKSDLNLDYQAVKQTALELLT